MHQFDRRRRRHRLAQIAADGLAAQQAEHRTQHLACGDFGGVTGGVLEPEVVSHQRAVCEIAAIQYVVQRRENRVAVAR